MRAVVLELCLLSGHLDPADFYTLPADVQRDWLAHMANRIEGWYRPGGRPQAPPRTP